MKRLLARTLLAVLLAQLALLVAMPAHADTPEFTLDEAGYQKILAAVKKSGAVKVFSRDITVYTWVSRLKLYGPLSANPFAKLDPQAPSSVAAILKSIDDFKTKAEPGPGNYGGAGLYLAIDPLSSFMYGRIQPLQADGFWSVTALELAKNQKFLDTVQPELDDVIGGLIFKATDADCTSTGLQSLFRDYDEPACRAIRDRLTEDTGIVAIRYPYEAVPLAGCSQRHPVAYVAIKPAAVVKGSIMTFTAKDLPGGVSPAVRDGKLRIQALWDEAFAGVAKKAAESKFNLGISEGYPWPKLSGKVTGADYAQWKASHIAGCGDYAEDQSNPVPTN